jgi:hypothetical protein
LGANSLRELFYGVNALIDTMGDINIDHLDRTRIIPDDHRKVDDDTLYKDMPPLLRRISGHARLTIFNGAHNCIHNAGLNWLAHQSRGRNVEWDR